MTPATIPHKQRPEVPELRDIPLTFMDCPDRSAVKWSDGSIAHWCLYETKCTPFDYVYCEGAMKHGTCPRGFP